MASLTSLVSLGSACTCSSGQFEGSRSLVRRVSFSKDYCSFRKVWIGRRWSYISICKFSVTTEVIADQGSANSLSIDSTYGTGSKEDGDLSLRPSPRPVLKPKVEPVVAINSGSRDEAKFGGGSDKGQLMGEEERSKVIESLGEVLEKVEKLESSTNASAPVAPVRRVVDKLESSSNASAPVAPVRRAVEKLESSTNASAPVRRVVAPMNSGVEQRNGGPVGSRGVTKANTIKSVWRKGNPVSTVQKIVKEVPKIVKPVEDAPKTEIVGKVEAPPAAPLRPPQPPLRAQPMLRARPSVAPPPPVVRKPVILKDVGSAPRPATIVETLDDEKTKERKPILIDKFASKKPAIDPLTSQVVAKPSKPGKTPAPGRFREDIRRRGGTLGGSRRRRLESDHLDDDLGTGRKGRKWSKASRKAARLQAAKEAEPVKAEILEVGEEGMLTEELAFNLATNEAEILSFLYGKGIRLDGVQALDKDIVKMVCKEYEVEVIDAAPTRIEEMAKKKEIFDEDDLDKLEDRPPVLTIMGHVDHGKTTLLDFIRKSKVAASEAGGITQGIGAYKVQVPVDGNLRPCVFLDTPGHEAFGAMRARGARVTDIAIIVVAADDGIRPQTSEAIAHAKAAGVPIVIAINKIDKEGANPERVMEELSSIGLMPEDWGGDIPMVQISALKGENVDDLLETVMLVAELQELKANPHRNAKGTVIEAGLDKAKGPVATFIVQNGTLKLGDIVVCGEAFGKVRALFDDDGKRVNEAGPSIPIQVIGLNNVPCAGDEFEVVDILDVAREKAELRAESLRSERMSTKAGDGKVTLSSFASAVSSGRHVGLDMHQLNLIMKVDLQGSIEAVRQALQVLPQDTVTLKFILQATGDVTKSDVDLAVATQAIIFGFNVRTAGSVKTYAERKGVEIRMYKVIYEFIDDVRTAMEGLLESVEDQIPIGSAEVRAVFSSGSGRIAGSFVTEGKVTKGCGVRVLRKGRTVFVGDLDSLRRVKENVKEVGAGLECGIGVDEFDDWVVGDVIEAFNKVQKRRTLEEASASMAAAKEEVGN